MKPRDLILVVVGLVVGLVLGVLLFASNGSVGNLLTGTVLNAPGGESAYYLITLDEGATWLGNSIETVDTAALDSAVEQINTLPTAENFRQTFQASADSIELLLSTTYGAINGEAQPTTVDGIPSNFVCLALDNDLYSASGPEIYMYSKLPADTAAPESWTKLDGPKLADLYWQLLACQPQLGN